VIGWQRPPLSVIVVFQTFQASTNVDLS